MSWSWNGIGKPSKVKAALAKFGDGLTDMSKEEFDGVRPGIDALLDANTEDHAISLSASGHGWRQDGVLQHSTCQIDLKNVGTLIE